MSGQDGTASASEAGSSLADEEQDWLPQETKDRVARRRPDYQLNQVPCEACQ